MMSDDKWREVTPSQFPWEQKALEWVRERLPDHSPFCAWSNFEFIALDGGLWEIDLLVFSKAGVFLVEIKSYRGDLDIGPQTWVHTANNGTRRAFDNPFRLANFKAKKLRELLQHNMPKNVRAPYIEALVFLSDPELNVTIRPPGGNAIVFPEGLNLPDVMDALIRGEGPGIQGSRHALDRPTMKRFDEAMTNAEIEPASKHRRIGGYRPDWDPQGLRRSHALAICPVAP